MSVYSARTSTSRRSGASILRKSTSLKSRISQIVNTPSKVRFELPHARRVGAILSDYLASDENKRDYERFVCTIRDCELLEEDVLALLKEANDCIVLLNAKLRLFVEAIVNIPWLGFSEKVHKQYRVFIVNVLSAHNYHSKLVIERLVDLFADASTLDEWPDGVPIETDTVKCSKVHAVLKTVLTKIPMCKMLLPKIVAKKYPFYKRPTHLHEYQLYNVLRITEYSPMVRSDMLYSVISKLVMMDVNIKADEISLLSLMDVDEADDDAVPKRYEVSGVAHTLDVCLCRLFEYMDAMCHPSPDAINWENLKGLYQELLLIFDSVLLPTNTKHVQFVMFSLCSFKPLLGQCFLDYLWKKVCNHNVPQVLRQAAAAYIASFLARATYLPLSLVKEFLKEMSDWIHSYISANDCAESVSPDLRVHMVFYSVCQAVFHLISVQHKSLMKTKKRMVFLRSLNLSKMVNCLLNPLRVCHPSVVRDFASVTRQYGLVYCYTVLEQNSRQAVPTIYQDDKGAVIVNDNSLPDYFPFDPYLLPRSGKYIQPYYREQPLIHLNDT